MNQRQKNTYTLKSDNLIPIYLLEDNLRQNFTSIQIFIEQQLSHNKMSDREIKQLNIFDQNIMKKIDNQFVQTQKRIVKNINNEIEGKITVALNQRLNLVMERITQKQTAMNEIQSSISKQIQQSKKKILYEITQENQKFFTKEIKKVQKDLQKKTQKQLQSSKIKSLIGAQKNSKKQIQPQIVENNNGFSHQNIQQLNWQQNHLQLTEMQQKISKLEQFSIGIDKRFFDNSTTLKQSWKQFGNDILETKNKLGKKMQQISIDLAKVKNQIQFTNMPNQVDQSYKVQLIQKFTQIYKVLTTLVTKTQFDSNFNKLKKLNDKANSQMEQLKLRLTKNDQYFTLYMNNSNTDDLTSEIQKIRMELVQDKKVNNQFFQQLKSKIKQDYKLIKQIGGNISDLESQAEDLNNKIQVTVNNILKCTERIQKLEDFNDIGPSKIKKIQDILDFDMVPGVQSQQLFNSTQHNSTNNNNKFGKYSKELKMEIDKLKDQIFLLTSESKSKNQEFEQTKKMVKKLEQRLEKFKNQSQQAVISRKPWICLSCDKNQKDQDKEKQLKRKFSNKKIEVAKSGGGFLSGRQKSQKNIVPSVSPFEQKFQIYQKFKQKYLTDTLKLPDIYKQKIGDLQSSLL